MRISDIFITKGTEELIRQLYPKSEAGRMIRKHKKQKSLIFTLMIVFSVLVFIPVFIIDWKQSRKPVKELHRNEAGYGSRAVTLDVATDSGYSDRITVNVNDRIYSDEELEEYSRRLDEILWTQILGDNESAGYVTSELNLMDRVDGFPFDISWKGRMLPLSSVSSGIYLKAFVTSPSSLCILNPEKTKAFSLRADAISGSGSLPNPCNAPPPSTLKVSRTRLLHAPLVSISGV